MHEAAHAVAAVQYGIDFRRVFLRRRMLRVPSVHCWAEGGRIEVYAPESVVTRYREERISGLFLPDLDRSGYRFLTMLLAPAAFEKHYFRVSYRDVFQNTCRGDLDDVHRMLAPLKSSGIDADLVIGRTLRRTERFVRQHEPTILLLGLELLDRRTMSRAEVEQFVLGEAR